MTSLICVLGNLAGVVGVLICLSAGLVRVSGTRTLAEFDVMTFFFVGMALMVMACLAKVHVMQAGRTMEERTMRQ